MRCNYCEWRCELGAQTYGICRMYLEDRGEIKERFPHRWSTYAMSRIESLPFYHAYPGSRSLTIGTSGCNFLCRYCSNGYIARRDPEELAEDMHELTPEELVSLAVKLQCHNIVFNVNEPMVSLQSLHELKKWADRAGLPMGCLTNAYATEEGTELLASIFDFINIGFKGFSSAFHKEYIGIPDIDPILRNIRRLASIRHIEVTTPIIQDVNDHEMDAIAAFLAGLDPEIPWHAFRLLPEHEMKDTNYPSIERINTSLESARKRLAYVYFHNFVGSDWVNTICPGCGADVIERISLGCGGDKLDRFHCLDNRCHVCRKEIRMHGTLVARKSSEAVL